MADPHPAMTLRITVKQPWLLADLGYRHRVAGWPIYGPAWGDATIVAWLQETGSNIQDRLRADRIEADIGMMTAARIEEYRSESRRDAAMEVTAVTTADLTKGVHILLHANLPLSDAAMLEALSLVAQARTEAIASLGISRLDGSVVTGTGNDGIVVAAPHGPHEVRYCGLNTALGRLIAEVTRSSLISKEARP